MRQAKRFLSGLLVLCLLTGLVPVAAMAAEENLPFTDVTAKSWFYEAAKYVHENDLMGSTGGDRFSPGEITTRGMLVTVLHRMEGEPAASGRAFPDVAAGQWYTNAVAWASANGIVTGYDDGRFGPNDTITREQAAAILYRYAQHKGYDLPTSGSLTGFPDADKISAYAVEAMVWAVSNGFITGFEDGTLSPGAGTTRAQVATVLMRFHRTASKII